jgi:HEAT repeat protein
MRRRIVMAFSAALCLISIGFSGSVAIGEPPPTREAVLQLLSGYEYIPTRSDLERFGPKVPSVLIEIVTDPAAMKHHRLRALDALQHYPDRPDVQNFLTRILSDTHLPSGFLEIAMTSLGRTAKASAIDTLKPFLSSKDIHTREAAARALFYTGDPSASPLLKGAAAKEAEPFFKERLMKLSQRLEIGRTSEEEDEDLNRTQQNSIKKRKQKDRF